MEKTPIEFARKLVKGKIAEVIFDQMIRGEGNYTVIPFGYEHTTPTLAQYRHITEVPRVLENIADAPDFALISEDKAKIYLVEVKYQRDLNIDFLKKSCERLLKRWESPWMFVATHEGFYCAPCSAICKNESISPLPESWVKKSNQDMFLSLLKEFISK